MVTLSLQNSYSQKTTVIFTSDKDCEVLIFEPIDNGYNNKIPTTKLISSATKPAIYDTSISSYTFIYCQFPQYQKTCNIILFPKDSVQVHLSNTQIKFQGSNHSGQQYLYNNFQVISFSDRYEKMQNIAKEYIARKRNLYSIIPTINNSLVFPHIKAIEELSTTANISTTFTQVMKTNVKMLFNSFTATTLYMLLKNHHKNAEDSLYITTQLDSIFREIPINEELLKYPYKIYILRYLNYYYKNRECLAGHDSSTFGPYKYHLYAPKKMQPVLLGSAYMTQLKYDTGEMDLNKLTKFFNNEYPDSEYTAIINERAKERGDLKNERSANPIFIKEKIGSLEQLKIIPELKGKYLYLDLWASWCMPCRLEFSYKNQVDTVLNTYKGIATVYISIDQEKQEKAWLNCIKHYKLDGFHLRASSELQQNILEQVFGTDTYEIPRYILISPTSEILHKNLSRPSNYPKLKEELDSLINK